MQTAKYLGVAPWELIEQPLWWREKASIAMAAEEQAREIVENARNKQ